MKLDDCDNFLFNVLPKCEEEEQSTVFHEQQSRQNGTVCKYCLHYFQRTSFTFIAVLLSSTSLSILFSHTQILFLEKWQALIR